MTQKMLGEKSVTLQRCVGAKTGGEETCTVQVAEGGEEELATGQSRRERVKENTEKKNELKRRKVFFCCCCYELKKKRHRKRGELKKKRKMLCNER